MKTKPLFHLTIVQRNEITEYLLGELVNRIQRSTPRNFNEVEQATILNNEAEIIANAILGEYEQR